VNESRVWRQRFVVFREVCKVSRCFGSRVWNRGVAAQDEIACNSVKQLIGNSLSSVETITTFKTGFDTVNLHRLTVVTVFGKDVCTESQSSAVMLEV
jgi:hypothetical protein